MQHGATQLTLDRTRIVQVLAGVCVTLVALGVGAGLLLRGAPPFSVESVARLFLLDAEAVVPAWWTASLLLLCALALPLAAAAVPAHRRRLLLLAVAFVALSVDEASVVHERATGLLNLLLTGDAEGDKPVWVVVALPVVVAVGLYVLPVLRSAPTAVQRRWYLALVLYVGGAVVVEVLVNAVLGVDVESVGYVFAAALEEGLEMLGVVVFLDSALLLAAGGRPGPLVWRLGAPPVSGAVAPVDVELLPGDEAGSLRGEEADRFGHVVD